MNRVSTVWPELLLSIHVLGFHTGEREEKVDEVCGGLNKYFPQDVHALSL